MSSMNTADPRAPKQKDGSAYLREQSTHQATLLARTFMLLAFKPPFAGGDVSMGVTAELRTHYLYGMSQLGKKIGSARSS